MTYVDELKQAIAYIRKETKAGRLGRADRLKLIDEASTKYALAHAELNDRIKYECEESGRETPYNPMDERLLEQLATLALDEELTEKASNKSRTTEYPFLSAVQLARRQSGAHEAKRKEQRGESPWKAAATIATDGRDYRQPTRRKRSDYEDLLRNREMQSKNAERRRKYHEFTKVQPVFTCKMGENVSY